MARYREMEPKKIGDTQQLIYGEEADEDTEISQIDYSSIQEN